MRRRGAGAGLLRFTCCCASSESGGKPRVISWLPSPGCTAGPVHWHPSPLPVDSGTRAEIPRLQDWSMKIWEALTVCVTINLLVDEILPSS